MLVGQASPAALQAAARAELGQAGEGRPGPGAPGVFVNPHRLPADTMPDARRTTGSRVIPRRTPVDPGTFERLKERANAAAQGDEAPEDRTASPAGDGAEESSGEPRGPADGPGAAAPARGIVLGPTFPTLDRYEGANAGFIFNPPDGALAVGPTSLLAAVNEAFAIYDRAGTRRLGPVEFNAFFGTADFPFDPRALFDPGNAAPVGYGGGIGRFVLVATTGGAYTLAVSQDDHPERPTTGWCTYRLDATTTGPDGVAAADFPGLGMDGDNLYVTSNQFTTGGFQQARLLVIPKASVYPDATTGACPAATSTDFQSLRQPDGSLAFTVQPAHQPDALPGRATAAAPATMHLVNALFPAGTALVARAVTTSPSGTPGRTTPTLHPPAWVGAGPYDMPASALQPGALGRFIDTGDTRLWAGAVDRYGRLYTANATRTVRGRVRDANPYANTLWYEITPTSPATYESPARTHVVARPRVALFFPGVMPGCADDARTDRRGNVRCAGSRFVGLQLSGSGRFTPASAYAGLDGGGDPLVRRYQAGVPGYELNDRWGDYPGVSADPSTHARVWVLGEYAKATDAWGTAVTAIGARVRPR